MASYRSPAMCDAVIAFTCKYCLRMLRAVIESDEFIPAGIESCNVVVYGEYSVVISSLSVLCLVIDIRALYFNFTDREVALEVG